jgi:hypothetical protein
MLRVKNVTRNTLLIKEGRVADTIWRRLRGLIGVRQMLPGDGILISPCHSIHTHFMSIPIDVLYVDKHHRIVHIDKNMQTWRFGRWHRHAQYVLEVPSGVADQSHAAIGDQLNIIYN